MTVLFWLTALEQHEREEQQLDREPTGLFMVGLAERSDDMTPAGQLFDASHMFARKRALNNQAGPENAA